MLLLWQLLRQGLKVVRKRCDSTFWAAAVLAACVLSDEHRVCISYAGDASADSCCGREGRVVMQQQIVVIRKLKMVRRVGSSRCLMICRSSEQQRSA
jgi:hypothetical protein